jgi:hypothetical protein
MLIISVLRISFFVEAVDQPEKEEDRRSAIAVVELQVSSAPVVSAYVDFNHRYIMIIGCFLARPVIYRLCSLM